ncbi:MAG: hypothetical protein QM662_07875 [Gordonia sp. (in: high G+C Gram-positive bacteria)]
MRQFGHRGAGLVAASRRRPRRRRPHPGLGALVLLLSSCAISGTPLPVSNLSNAPVGGVVAGLPTGTPVDPVPFARTTILHLLRAGDLAVCGIGVDAVDVPGNLTCHLPPGAIPALNPSVVDIDANGVHAAAWTRWPGDITELLPGQSLTVGTGTCVAAGGPRLRCENPGGWVDITPTGTTTSMPPQPLTAEHGGP